jgi:predicted PurR-regulated permease PerM
VIDKILKDKKLLLTIIILLLSLFVLYSLLEFLSAFIGAILLAFIFKPLNKFFIRKLKFSKSHSAIIILIISLIIIIIPIIIIVDGLINQVKLLPNQIDKFKDILPKNIIIDNQEIISQSSSLLSKSIKPIFSNVSEVLAILFLMFFLLYYFIVNEDLIEKKIYENLPFNEKNNKKIIKKFKDITYGTIIGTFFIALIQGFLIAINFYFLDIPNFLFWGFVTVILSFIPFFGAQALCIPIAIFLILTGSLTKGLAVLILGFIIGSIDNFLRPIINIKYGDLHPLVSIIGIYIGLSQFGIIGIFIGPMLLEYLLLFWEIYKENYLK